MAVSTTGTVSRVLGASSSKPLAVAYTAAVLPVEPPDVRDAPALADEGFRPLAALEIRGPRRATALTRGWTARYGDAFALVEPLDPEVSLRVLSVLQSGRVVETRALAHPGPPPSDAGALLARALGRRAERVRARYPDRPTVGVHRQLVDVADVASLWVAHRGLVRRVQGADDEVVDHHDPYLLVAALHRLAHVEAAVDRPDLAAATRAARALRDVLLTLPALLGLASGLAWWSSGLVAGVPAACALIARAALTTPAWRVWLLGFPPAVLLVGWFTLGWAVVAGVLAYALLVVALAEDVLVALLQRVLRTSHAEPAPVPSEALVEHYT